MTNFSQMIGLHMTKCSHICMTKYSKNDEGSRGNPNKVPKLHGERAIDNKKNCPI